MNKTLQDYFFEFEKKFKDLKEINADWYKKELDVQSYCSKALTKDKDGKPSEEFIRARFVWSLIASGMYQKEYMCVEFLIPKGNGGKSLNPDIVIFKNKEWLKDYEEALKNKDFKKIRQNLLVIFEAKKNAKSVDSAIENQLRPAMAENESKDRIFGIYFDNKNDIIVFKKLGNSELVRFNESKQIEQGVFVGWNLNNRDQLLDLPSQDDFLKNNESISDLKKLTFDALDAIDEETFTEQIDFLKRAKDRIRPESDIHQLIVEFLTLKVFDEKRSKREKKNCNFFILSEESENKIKDFRLRISQLYKDAQKEYSKILSSGKRVFQYDNNLRPLTPKDEKFLMVLIECFQKRAILKATNESFNQIIFNNFGNDRQKADKDQFFTPIPVIKAIIKMLNPKKGEEFCDPCCGIADFPAMAYKHTHRNDVDFPLNADNLYGFDLEAPNLKLAELNLVLNGDGGANLEHMNSLSQKLLLDNSILKEGYFTTEYYKLDDWSNLTDPTKDLKKFKIVATNPPFGKGRDLKTGADGKWDLPKETMELYETYKIKSSPDKKGKINYPNSMDMGALFLENAYKILEDGGRMAIVLSNSLASIKEWENVREWFIQRMRIVALFDLPSNTFGETGVATTIIIAYKPKINEQHLLNNDYSVFIKEIKNLGYEVKTKNRTVHFNSIFKLDENTFEPSNQLEEDFSEMIEEFKEFLKLQEEEIKKSFGE